MSLRGRFYKFVVRTIGKQSEGIEIAKTYGLNSAEMMEYVYRHVPAPRGNGFLGIWADKVFLEFPTWNSIRKRKANLQNMIYHILRQRLDKDPGKEIKVLDLASGYSQYIFPVLSKLGEDANKIYVEMRDKNPDCESHLKRANTDNYNIKFVLNDITKEENYDLNNKFDIVILAGFYDSIDMKEVTTINNTMKFINKIMNDDALFIYSYQASHVDAELVNELFRDTNGVPLSMGERPKIDMQYIMSEAGFKTIGQMSDEEGRYPLVISAKTSADIDFVEKFLTGNINHK